MSLKISKSALFKSAAVIHIWKGGAWKTVARASIWKTHGTPSTTGWRNFIVPTPTPTPTPTPPTPTPTPTPTPAPPITLNVTLDKTSPLAASRMSTVSPAVVSSATVTATPHNGTGPYTYTWTRVSWTGSNTPGITAPNAAATGFTLNMPVGTQQAIFKCTVQDSLGNTGSVQITVNFTLNYKDWNDTGNA